MFMFLLMAKPFSQLQSIQFSSVTQSCPTLCSPMNLSTPRPPCPSPSPGLHSNSRPSSQWCHPATSSSVIPFSSRPQYLPASGSFPMSQLFIKTRHKITVDFETQMDFPDFTSGKEPTCQCGRHRKHGFDPWVGKIPWRRAWQLTPVFLPGESHGQRSLAGYGL